MKRKVLFFGPYPPPLTGQSVAFKQVYDNFDGDKIIFNTAKYKGKRVLNSLYCFAKLPLVFLTSKFNKVYFTCSRGRFSYIRDMQLLLLCRIFNIKVINHLHGADFIDFYNKNWIRKRIVKYNYDFIKKSIVLLPSMKEQFSDFKKMELEVISNSYSPEFNDYQIDSHKKNLEVVYFSNLMYSKGIIHFLNAAQELLDLNKKIIVKVGGVPMGDNYRSKKEIQNEFDSLRIKLKEKFPNRFFYLGLVTGEQKVKLLQDSSIFVLPTFYVSEAFPISIIEAMFFRNVIITTKHNYLSDIISEKNGILIDKKSVKSISNAILEIIRNKDLMLRIQNTNHFEAKKSFNPVLFNRLVNQAIIQI